MRYAFQTSNKCEWALRSRSLVPIPTAIVIVISNRMQYGPFIKHPSKMLYFASTNICSLNTGYIQMQYKRLSIPLFLPLSIHLPKHQIHRPNNRHRIRQQLAPTNLIKAAQMRKPRRANLAPIRSLAAITNNINTHLALRGFDCGISFPWRDGVAFCEE